MAWACSGQPPPPCSPRGSAWATLCGQPACCPGLRFLRGQPPASDLRGQFLHLLARSGPHHTWGLAFCLRILARSWPLAPAAPVSPLPTEPQVATCELPCPHDTPWASRFPRIVPTWLHPLLCLQGLCPKKVLLCPRLVPFMVTRLPPSLLCRSLNSSTLERGAGEWVAFLLWASVTPEPGGLSQQSASQPPCPGPVFLGSGLVHSLSDPPPGSSAGVSRSLGF